MKQPLALQTGRIQRPQKAVIYGPEGIGKSTLASQFPSPIFLDTEGGTHHLNVTRLPICTGWEDVTKAIVWLGSEAHDFKTLVVDTADWLEKLLVEFICQRDNKTSVEDFGYGKGYVILAEEFTKFLASLEPLLRRGMHILLLAHCRIVKFEQPEAAGAYDRYELKLTKQVAPLLREWCDMQLFANYFTRVAENESGKKRGVGGRERVFYTCHTAAWDAKNRHGFEEKLPFAFASIASAFGTMASVQKPAPIDKLAELFSGKEAAVNAFLLSRSQIKQGQTWRDLSAEERQHAKSLGLLKPMIDRSGSTSRDEDACLSSIATESIDTSASDDPPAAPSPLASDTDERLWDILRRLLGELLNQTNAKLSLDCLAIASGMGFLGDSMTEIAKRNGVTRAAVSKRCVELTQKLKLDPSRAMRSLTARTSYAHTQHLIHRNNEQRNRESR